jgi:DNA polymerase epsilon subunit 1
MTIRHQSGTWIRADLMEVRRELLPIVNSNKGKSNASVYKVALDRDDPEADKENMALGSSKLHEQLSTVVDIREHDVPYHMRYCIDNELRCGKWYDIRCASNASVTLDARLGSHIANLTVLQLLIQQRMFWVGGA